MRISDWSSDVCSSDLGRFFCGCTVEFDLPEKDTVPEPSDLGFEELLPIRVNPLMKLGDFLAAAKCLGPKQRAGVLQDRYPFVRVEERKLARAFLIISE